MSSGLILKMNNGYNGVSRELEKFTKWGGKWSHTPCLKGRRAFIGHTAAGSLWTSYFYIQE
jgi:hypothetical protein